MEQLSQLTENQRIEVNEYYARKFAAERDAEREEDAKQAREEKERKRTQAQDQESRSDAHPTTATVTTLEQAFSAGMAMNKTFRFSTYKRFRLVLFRIIRHASYHRVPDIAHHKPTT